MSDTIFSYYKVSIPDNQPIDSRIGLESFPERFDSTRQYKGYVCIKIDRPPKESAGPFTYKLSYSFCSPVDNFSRKISRNICKSRSGSARNIEVVSTAQLNARELSERAINLLHEPSFGNARSSVNGVKIPNWFSLTPRDQITPHRRYRNKKQ